MVPNNPRIAAGSYTNADAIRNREWREKNREKRREYKRKWKLWQELKRDPLAGTEGFSNYDDWFSAVTKQLKKIREKVGR